MIGAFLFDPVPSLCHYGDTRGRPSHRGGRAGSPRRRKPEPGQGGGLACKKRQTTVTRDSIRDIVTAVISDTFDCAPNAIHPETVADDVDGWDSLSHTILMVRIQNRLGIGIPEWVAAGSPTVGALIDNLYIVVHGKSANPPT